MPAAARISRAPSGITLIESVVGLAVFAVISFSLYQTFITLFQAVKLNRLRITAAALAEEQMEIIRNLPYADVGIVAGLPGGKIPHLQQLVRDGVAFTVTTTIRNVDDPFDGTIGGSPNDLSPADYKLVETEIGCASCRGFAPLIFTTTAAPKNLETASINGALFIQVFDANGLPIEGADVHIVNALASPALVIDDVTNSDGKLQLVDAPPGNAAYAITVSKPGYSTERTYPPGGAGNPNPIKPDATVVVQQVTQVSFAIDAVGALNVSGVTPTCAPMPGIHFNLTGAKLIGSSPDVVKYGQDHLTDGGGNLAINTLEWDTYTMTPTDTAYNLAGTVPIGAMPLSPGSSQNLQLIISPKRDDAVMVTVKDNGTKLPISGAIVRLTGPSGYDETLTTGRGFLRQSDWSGGSGQTLLGDPLRYLSDDGNVEVDSPAGELRLMSSGGFYPVSGALTSSTFDTGSTSNFYNFTFIPTDQPPVAGQNSVKFQLATNNNQTDWNFLGPDGTPWTYYTATNTNISATHNGDRYLRYQAHLTTENATTTPNLSEIAFTFTSSCVAPGQVLFDNLAAGNYNLTVSAVGYQDFSDTVSVSTAWQHKEAPLSP